ncbi:hypothetical protein QCE47_28510 [Caballeronia sp. LZ025]|uniref:hypothetical protein n=1 Tax=Caballeronia TaxID=1827195 RepID=UPI001FD0429F|nr:hypothetical protein [Caballeronia grimmiae]MDR5736247.1 hypothetical protein [Caballeronia sp. LZ025]
MTNNLHISEPVTISRPRGAHRFEAFSPKLARRVTFYRRALLEQWLLLEANPKVISFCERPGYVLIDGNRRLADFWVRFADREELVVLIEESSNSDAEALGRDLDAASQVRLVASGELAAARVWTDNWQRILPYLVANRGLAPSPLPQAIARFLKGAQRLLTIEREFAIYDLVIVRATLFGLLHTGRVGAPELQTQPLSLLTSFTATGAIS